MNQYFPVGSSRINAMKQKWEDRMKFQFENKWAGEPLLLLSVSAYSKKQSDKNKRGREYLMKLVRDIKYILNLFFSETLLFFRYI